MSDQVKKWLTIATIVVSALTAMQAGRVSTGIFPTVEQPAVVLEDDLFAQIQRELADKEEALAALAAVEERLEDCKKEVQTVKRTSEQQIEQANRTLKEAIKALEQKIDEDSGGTSVGKPVIQAGSIAERVQQITEALGRPKREVFALVGGFKVTLLGMQSGVLNEDTVIPAQRAANATALNLAAPNWELWRQQLRDILNNVRDQGKLESLEDHKLVWAQIISGLEAAM